MTATTILQPTTAQAYSTSFSPRTDSLSVTVIGLQGTETAILEIYDNINNNWVPAQINSIIPTFNATNNTLDIYRSYDTYRVNKSATSAAVGVSLLN